MNKILLENFRAFLSVDLQLEDLTIKHHIRETKKFLRFVDRKQISKDLIRAYLMSYKGKSSSTYKNALSTMKRLCRDYLQNEHLVSTFKFPKHDYKPKTIPTREEIQKFYSCLATPKEKALVLFYATTGLRKVEVLKLLKADIDLDLRMVNPKSHSGNTKHSWVSFFNEECKAVLVEHLSSRGDSSPKLFPFEHGRFDNLWKTTREKSGIRITPQSLRDFFCMTMGELNVPDRFVDAFCGRTPKSVLARNYTDYTPAKLKKIYDNANLKVLS